MADEPILELRRINKSFGPVHVLKGVDFSAYAGQVTALVGDNGAGKSTLVKCISGTYSIDSGDYLFEGHPVTVHTPRDASVSWADCSMLPSSRVMPRRRSRPRNMFWTMSRLSARARSW